MANTHRVTVELGFKANTQNVKKNLTDLQANLQKITNMEVGLKYGSIDQARNAAQVLGMELQKAVNIDTGRLDLSKLNKSLKSSGYELGHLSQTLLQIGPTGTQTFMQLAQAVSQAELPVVKMNKNVKKFMENIGNSMKWQIAQTATNAIQSTLSNAVREAEQLNSALNDIRIVTGYDATAMAQFAKQANKAAKELKTTTKQYAEASLIFYQQGLTGDEVSKRADTVIKLSQVTGDSAKAVSDQMTAIWNNFADGTKTLEYYADAMAKLGADTAASTSEIASGLEKFAAIAETVGLNYETAMASVATVIDKTRQSADVVGTAFKTIFARIQGLSLDGVTDDGISLNKYSEALERVGVDVLTASGELRDMDDILSELGSKWAGLGRETQVAVAQTVGGARQYNQFLSLMDNWTAVQSNINKAMSSTGELGQQAKIWGESYEAAAQRVEEAKARLSENFLNSDSVVTLTNVFADLIEGVDTFVDRMGGVVPIITLITMLLSKKLMPLVKTGLRSTAEAFTTIFNNMTGRSETAMSKIQKQMAMYAALARDNADSFSEAKQLELTRQLLVVKEQMAKTTKHMSLQEQEAALAVLHSYEAAVQRAIEANKKIAENERNITNIEKSFTGPQVREGVKKAFLEEKGLDESDERAQKLIQMASDNKITSSSNGLSDKEFLAKENQELAALKEKAKKYWDETGNDSDDDSSSQNKSFSSAPQGYSTIDDLEKEIAKKQDLVDAIELKQRLAPTKIARNFGKASFGEIDTSDAMAMEEVADPGVKEKVSQLKKSALSTVNTRDYTFGIAKTDSGALQVTLENYEALSKQAANYHAQLTKIAAINEDIANFSAETEAEDIAKEEKAIASEEQNKAQYEVDSLTKKGSKASDEEIIKAKEKLKQANEKLEKAELKLNNVQAKSNKSKQNAIALLKHNKKELLEVAKKAGYSEDQLKALNKEIDDLSPDKPQGLQKLQSEFAELEQATQGVQEGLESLAATMREELGNNLDDSKLQALDGELQQYGKNLQEVTESEIKLTRQEESMGEVLNKSPGRFEAVATGAMEVVGAVQGLYMGIQSLGAAFTESSSAGEFFTNFLGSLLTLIPSVVAIFKVFGTARDALSKKIQAAAAKDAAAETTGAIAKVTAWLATHTASLNIAGVVAAGAALTLLGAAGIASAISANKTEKQHEQDTAAIEATKQSNELAEASVRESKAIDDLTLEYNKLVEAKMDTAEVTEDIINQLDKVVEGYKKYREELDLTSDAETSLAEIEKNIQTEQRNLEVAGSEEERTDILNNINQQRRKADEIIAEEAIKKSKKGQKAVLQEVSYQVGEKEIENAKVTNEGVKRNIWGAWDDRAAQILRDKMGNQAVPYGHGNSGASVTIRQDTPEHFITDYDNLKAAIEQMEKEKLIEDNDVLREARELLTQLTPSYDKLKEFVKQKEAQQISSNISQLAAGKKATQYGGPSKIEDVSNYRDYQNYIFEVAGTKDTTTTEYQAAKAHVDSLAGTSPFAQAESKIRGLVGGYDEEGNYFVKDTKTKEALENFVTELNKEDLEAFIKVNTNIYETTDIIKTEIARIKKDTEKEKIELKIKAISDTMELLSPEGMTEEDWNKISENELFKDNPEGFQNFLKKFYAEQLAWLGADLENQNKAKQQNFDEQQKLYQDQLNILGKDLERARAELKVANATGDKERIFKAKEAKDSIEKSIAYIEKESKILQNEELIWQKIREEALRYAKELKKSDIFDIYRDLNKELDKLKEKYQDLQDVLNSTYGDAQIKAYKDMVNNLKEQNKQLGIMSKVDLSEIALSREILNQKSGTLGLESLGLSFDFDAEGRISNYSEIMNALYNEAVKQGENAAAYVENTINPIKELLDNYDSKWEVYDSRKEEIEKNQQEQLSLNYQKITKELELNIELDEVAMKKVNYQFEKLSKTISGVADAVKLFSNKMNSVEANLNFYKDYVDALDADYAAKEITQSDYVEGLKKSQDAIYNQLEAMDSLEEEIINYYGETLQKAQEEIDKYANRIDHASSVLNHYKTILELTGKATSAQTRTVLAGISAVAESNLTVSRKEYEFYNNQAVGAKAKLDDYIASQGDNLDKVNDTEYKILEKQWLDATEAAENAQNDMLEKTAAWGEAMKAEVQYDMQEIAKSLEKAFTGGISFEELTTTMERRSMLQEEYLTTTNKIYETTKMMRTAQNAIDASTNSLAKQKLKSFIDETKQLQNQEKLSSFELDIQQKKYDLLVAEIALKDAQNAKSVARLTRTAEGGFGYVYTADENKVSEAVQQYEDAENALYNARLDAANNYAEKSIQTQQEFAQALAELETQRLEGAFETEEEYQRRRDELVAFYHQRLLDFSSLYSTAIQDDLRVTKDAWTSDFATMVNNSENWQLSVNNYIDQVDKRFSEWEKTIDEIEKTTGIDLNNIAGSVNNVKTEAENLATQLSKPGGTIDQVEGLTEAAKDFITEQAENWKAKVNELTSSYLALAESIEKAIWAQSKLNNQNSPDTKLPETEPSETEQIQAKWKEIHNLIKAGEYDKAKETYANWSFGQSQGKTYQNAFNQAVETMRTNEAARQVFNDILAGKPDEKGNVIPLSMYGGISLAGLNKIKKTENPSGPEDSSTEGGTEDSIISQDKESDNISSKQSTLKNIGMLLSETTPMGHRKAIKEIESAFKEGIIQEKEYKALQALCYLLQTPTGTEDGLSNVDRKTAIKIAQDIASLGAVTDFNAIKMAMPFKFALRIGYIKNKNKTVQVQAYKENELGKYIGPYSIEELQDDSFISNVEPGIADKYNTNQKNSNGWGYKYRLQRSTSAGWIDAFNTGGYTGSWGPEGKLAMLHQKEIVLNADDTVNLLDSIQLLRSILTTIDLQAANAQFASLLSSSYFTPTTSEVLEQNVHIDAHFDSVTDRNEIVEAFNTLVNRASQYANRK